MQLTSDDEKVSGWNNHIILTKSLFKNRCKTRHRWRRENKQSETEILSTSGCIHIWKRNMESHSFIISKFSFEVFDSFDYNITKHGRLSSHVSRHDRSISWNTYLSLKISESRFCRVTHLARCRVEKLRTKWTKTPIKKGKTRFSSCPTSSLLQQQAKVLTSVHTGEV